MIANILVNVFGSLVFLFIFWKKLKEDHVPEIIFSAAYLIIGMLILSYFISFKFFPPWFFWMEVVGILIAFAFSVYKFKMRLLESFDALIISLLPWLSFTFLKDSVINSSLISFFGFIVILVLIFIYYTIDTRYKRFTWYKSGKIGLSALITLTVFFVARASSSFALPGMLTLVKVYEPYLSGAFAIISILMIFYLGNLEE